MVEWDTAGRRRLTIALVLTALFAYEAYALFVKRSGETAYTPPAAEIQASPEIAGETTLEQTFVMHADGLERIHLFARPSSGPAAGVAQLMLIGDTYAEPVARRTVPAAALIASTPFEWPLPRVDQSAGRTYTIRIALPEATPGHGVHFDVGLPNYVQGDLSIGGRSFWGDLRFETRAARVRLVDSLADLRRHAPPLLRSDFVLVLALVLFNAALVMLVLRLAAGSTPGTGPGTDGPEPHTSRS
jgi:hypothetical protein